MVEKNPRAKPHVIDLFLGMVIYVNESYSCRVNIWIMSIFVNPNPIRIINMSIFVNPNPTYLLSVIGRSRQI